MANKNANFANREVADLMLMDYSTKKMFLNVDWANVTSTSFEGDRVFATGGQGAPNRVQFDGSRTGTLTIEAQVYPVKVFQMLSGNELGTEANFLKREKVTAADSTKLTISDEAAGTYVQVFKADDDLGTELTATVSGKEVTVTVENGSDYIVYYYKKVATFLEKVIKYSGETNRADSKISGIKAINKALDQNTSLMGKVRNNNGENKDWYSQLDEKQKKLEALRAEIESSDDPVQVAKN